MARSAQVALTPGDRTLSPLPSPSLSPLIAATPAAPYYAVIFSSLRRSPGDSTGAGATAGGEHGGDHGGAHGAAADGYGAMAALMLASAARQDGYLGVESAREDLGITVSYWASLASIAAWKRDSEHQLAQQLGRSDWYSAYRVRICLVERDYSFAREGE